MWLSESAPGITGEAHAGLFSWRHLAVRRRRLARASMRCTDCRVRAHDALAWMPFFGLTTNDNAVFRRISNDSCLFEVGVIVELASPSVVVGNPSSINMFLVSR